MTNTTKNVETVIKTDDWGRMQTPAKRRERLLDEFERSSLSGAKFAAALPGFFPCAPRISPAFPSCSGNCIQDRFRYRDALSLGNYSCR